MTDTRTYRVHHVASRFRGEVVRVLIRPGAPGKRIPNNVLAETLTGEWFVCPFRGLRRVKP